MSSIIKRKRKRKRSLPSRSAMAVWSSFLQRILFLLSMISLHCPTFFCQAFSSQQRPQPQQQPQGPSSCSWSFEQFEFAPNGVCVQPAYFVCNNSNHQKHNNNKNDNKQQKQQQEQQEQMTYFTMRNVPGTGDCMFQAVILASLTSMGLGGNNVLLRGAITRETRAVVAQVLQSRGNLYIDKNRLVPARTLWLSAAQQEGLSPTEYLRRLQLEGQQGGLYGGGPELTVLSNVLRRPISIYEVLSIPLPSLDPSSATSFTTINVPPFNNKHNINDVNPTKKNACPIKCMGVFGDRFEDPQLSVPNSAVLSPGLQPGAYSWNLHILVLDVASTGEKHACVLLPQELPLPLPTQQPKQ